MSVDLATRPTPAVSASAPSQSTALQLILRTPLYRGIALAMLISGLGYSAAAPQIASFLVNELGASLTVAGLYYLTSLTAPIAGYLVGARSDRTGYRLGLFRICAVLGFAGWLGIAFSTELWMPFVISAVVLGFAGAATSQLFAALHDDLVATGMPRADGVVAISRMALTAGWVLGPVAGTFLAAQAGTRVMLVATAVCAIAQLVPLGTMRTGRAALAVGRSEATPRRLDLATMRPLLVFIAFYICVYAGESVKFAYLPIFMSTQLQLPAALSGAIIGVQPLVELILMPFAVILGRRVGMIRLMVVAAGFGVAANLCFAFTGTVEGLLVGQILMGAVWGVFMALGIIVAQRLLPSAIATASGLFFSSGALSAALGGVIGGLGADSIGLPLVFVFPAGFALIAMIGLAVMARSRPDAELVPMGIRRG